MDQKNVEPNFNSGFTEIPLNEGASSKKPSENAYSFSGLPPAGGSTVVQNGTLKFDVSGKLTITFTQGNSYAGATYVCQYVVY